MQDIFFSFFFLWLAFAWNGGGRLGRWWACDRVPHPSMGEVWRSGGLEVLKLRLPLTTLLLAALLLSSLRSTVTSPLVSLCTFFPFPSPFPVPSRLLQLAASPTTADALFFCVTFDSAPLCFCSVNRARCVDWSTRTHSLS